MNEHLIALQKCVDHWISQHKAGCTLEQQAEAILSSLEMAYAAGVKAATPPPGHVIDDAGNVRKVLGTLPVTKDGVVAMQGEEVYHPQQDMSFHLEVMRLLPEMDNDKEFPLPDDCEYIANYSYYERDTGYSQHETYDVRDCYSTREAAEAAEAARKEGQP